MQTSNSLEEVHHSVETQSGAKGWRKMLAFLGPAYLVSVGYMDPGNWATDLAGGSKYGYALIWVLVMSNLMAILLQSHCARLGIVAGKDLAQVNRETYPRLTNFFLYVLAELAIAATDLAEIIGMAIGLNLLTGLPLIWGVTITILDTFLLLYLQKLGIRRMEAFIVALIAVIFGSFALELFFVKPSVLEIAGGLIPALPDEDALYIAIGIIGATVMPHNLYLHSALVQTRKIHDDEVSKRKAIRWNFIDSTVALNLALFVNAAILILAATAFHKNGVTNITGIEEAHQLLKPLVGVGLAPILFAVALIAAGQSSTITGTLAGQIVMEGYLQIRMNPWMRRIVTRLVAIIPAFLTIWLAGPDKMTHLLIFSQVVLSVQLAFAIIPLIYAVSDKRRMGVFTIKPWSLILSIAVTAVIIYLNVRMVLSESMQLYASITSPFWKMVIILGLVLLSWLLLMTLIYPLIFRKKQNNQGMHRNWAEPTLQPERKLSSIALALDFGNQDEKVINQGLRLAGQSTRIVLIHVIESAAAKVLGKQIHDSESKADEEHLLKYAAFLVNRGYRVSYRLGYRNRISEIERICKEEKIELLVLGAHGHHGLFDFLYGQTIDSVRHRLDIPVLIAK
ncbi:MAG: Nramp family divalent metal transporter [Chitinophagaceae bacterium]|nr:Nramp family divalent metal transporter [Chitinophagaceae bacterium]